MFFLFVWENHFGKINRGFIERIMLNLFLSTICEALYVELDIIYIYIYKLIL